MNSNCKSCEYQTLAFFVTGSMITTKQNYLSEIIDAIFHIHSLKKKKGVAVLKT